MASVDTQREVTRAIVDTRDASHADFGGTTPEAIARKKAQERSREVAKAAAGDTKEAFQALKTQPIDMIRTKDALEGMIGMSDKDGSGNPKRSAAEQIRYDEIVKQTAGAREYEMFGIDGVIQTDTLSTENLGAKGLKEVVRIADLLPNSSEIFVKPDGRGVLRPMSDREKADLLKLIVAKPEFQAIVKKLQRERSDPTKAVSEFTQGLVDAKRLAEQRQTDEDRTIAKHKAIADKLKSTKDQLAEFSEVKVKGGVPRDGRSQAEIKGIDVDIRSKTGGAADLDKWEKSETTRLSALEADFKHAQAIYDKYKAGITVSGFVIPIHQPEKVAFERAEKARDDAQQELTEVKSLRRKKDDLLFKQQELTEQVSTQQEDEQKAREVMEDAQKLNREAKTDVAAAQRLQEAYEKQKVVELRFDTIMREAAEQYFGDQLEKYEADVAARLETEIADAKTDKEREILQTLTKKWLQPETRGRVGKFLKGDRSFVVNKDLVTQHFNELVNAGPDGLRSLAFSTVSKEDWANVQDKIIQQLIEYKLRAGGLKQGESDVIYDSPWGTGMLEAAMKRNAGRNANLDQLQAAGLIDGQDINSVKKFIAKHPFLSPMMLLMLLGAPIVGALAAGVAVASTGVAGAAGVGAVTGGAGIGLKSLMGE